MAPGGQGILEFDEQATVGPFNSRVYRSDTVVQPATRGLVEVPGSCDALDPDFQIAFNRGEIAH